MSRAISNKNVLTAKFEVAEFDGEFLASFGKPELRGAWLIYGGSGCGKTTFVMQVCNTLPASVASLTTALNKVCRCLCKRPGNAWVCRRSAIGLFY